jgi:hypothetical protein
MANLFTGPAEYFGQAERNLLATRKQMPAVALRQASKQTISCGRPQRLWHGFYAAISW